MMFLLKIKFFLFFLILLSSCNDEEGKLDNRNSGARSMRLENQKIDEIYQKRYKGYRKSKVSSYWLDDREFRVVQISISLQQYLGVKVLLFSLKCQKKLTGLI